MKCSGLSALLQEICYSVTKSLEYKQFVIRDQNSH